MKALRFWLTSIAILGAASWSAWTLWSRPPSASTDDAAINAGQDHNSSGGAASRGLASTPQSALQAPQGQKIPIQEVLKSYDHDFTEKGRALFEGKLRDYVQGLKAAAVYKDQWLAAGYSNEQDSLDGTKSNQIRFGVDQAGTLSAEELAEATEIDPSLLRGVGTRAERAAAIRENDARIAQANEALASRSTEIAALLKAGKKAEADALEQSILASVRGPASEPTPNILSESVYTEAERDEMGRRYLYTTFNREAEEGQ